MSRPVWNGTISFGLLNVPVLLQAAERRIDLHFRMIDSRSKKPIRYERINAETGEEVPWKNIVQAFEYEKGNYVVLSKEEIAAAAPERRETIELEAFVDRDAIAPPYFDKPYYLLPGKKAEKGYVLLREVLQKNSLVGIGHVVIRTRRYLCAVIPNENQLILNLLRFHQEIVDPQNFEFPGADMAKFRISRAELDMASKLIEAMTIPWRPDQYLDDYRERLHQLVEKRVKLKQGLVHEEEAPSGDSETAATNVVDFMALLKKSLQGGRGAKTKANAKTENVAKAVDVTPQKRRANAATKPAEKKSKRAEAEASPKPRRKRSAAK